ncbi:579_t:CDS:1, partial [Funneliformis mosseae]
IANAIINSTTRNHVFVKPVMSMVSKIRRFTTTVSPTNTYAINTSSFFFNPTSGRDTNNMDPISITATQTMRIILWKTRRFLSVMMIIVIYRVSRLPAKSYPFN